MPKYEITVWINWGKEMDKLKELNELTFHDKNTRQYLTKISQEAINKTLHGNSVEIVKESQTFTTTPEIPQGLSGNYKISDIDDTINNLLTIKIDLEKHIEDLKKEKQEKVKELNRLKQELTELNTKIKELELKINEIE